MQDFLSVFKKNKGAKPIVQNNIRIPDFNDKTHELDAHSFVLYGDASKVNFSNAGDKLPYIRFSSKTKFPSADKMPDDFDPQQILENGKAPGLNIADLHTMGITGKGITVAIIDQPLNTEHIEIKDNIIHYESAGYPEHIEAQFHGTAVSSLLAGKTVGVAPDAKIVYFAAPGTKIKMAIADEDFQKVLRQHFPKNINFEETIKDILDGRHQTDEEFRHKINHFIAGFFTDIFTTLVISATALVPRFRSRLTSPSSGNNNTQTSAINAAMASTTKIPLPICAYNIPPITEAIKDAA